MSMCRAPASTVILSASILRMRFIFIRRRVPPSATAQGAVEWLEPVARTGAGYFAASFMTVTMSSTEFASTMTLGCETRSPNQLVTSRSAILRSRLVLRPRRARLRQVIARLCQAHRRDACQDQDQAQDGRKRQAQGRTKAMRT